jgi:diguanylate cyclase (GGDEF)-like protein
MRGTDVEWIQLMESSLVTLLEAAEIGVLAFDRRAHCRMIGRRAGELFGIAPASFVGKTQGEVARAMSQCAADPAQFLQTTGALDTALPSRAPAEVELVRPRPRRVVWTSSPIVREGTVVGRLVLVHDVTRERALEAANADLLARIAEVMPDDLLTGLRNRRRFHEELERENVRSQRAITSYSVVRIDVDSMSEIHECFGMASGDRVLQRVAMCLNRCRREYDVLARYDRDTFAALLPGADLVAARIVTSRYSLAVEMQDFEFVDFKVTVSIGCAVWSPRSPESTDRIVELARVAAVKARASGTGRIEVHGDERPSVTTKAVKEVKE